MNYSIELDPISIKRSQRISCSQFGNNAVIDSYGNLHSSLMQEIKAILLNSSSITNDDLYDVIDFAHETLQNTVDATSLEETPFIQYSIMIEEQYIEIYVCNNGLKYSDSILFKYFLDTNIENQYPTLSNKALLGFNTHGGAGHGLLKLIDLVDDKPQCSYFYIGENEKGLTITGLRIVLTD